MNENNITRFEVSNFKKFDHLVVENIGQVNLITGDNNVGKTTLLEALLFSEDNTRWVKYLHQTLFYRGIDINASNVNTNEITFPNENYLNYIFKNINQQLVCKYAIGGNERELGIEYKTINNLTTEDRTFRKDKYNISNAKDWVLFYKNNKKDELQWLYYDDKEVLSSPIYWPYIPLDVSYGKDIRQYENALNRREPNKIDFVEKQVIINYLKIAINDIVDFDYKLFGNSFLHAIARESDINYRAVTTFGDGFQKYFRYVMTIFFANKIGDKRIMLDEVESGVHYLKMKNEWKAIFELSKQTGIQIFATTHSMDCIKAFVEAGEENEGMKDSLRLIELEEITTKDETNKHIATTFTHSQLEAYLDSEVNVRGGKLW